MEAEILLSEKTIESNKDFYKYVKDLNLTNKSTLILSDNSHFYYSQEELKKYKVIINLKQLNNIPDLSDFVYTIYKTLQTNTFFCGCFQNNKRPKYIKSPKQYIKFFEAVMFVLESRMKRLLSKKDVYAIFNSYNFKILDMKEINNITYFYAQKVF
jgi:hypothetical protein